MPSPFPGMNPFLEHPTVWHDFHERFCPAVAEVLTAQVRPNYIVKIDEHVFIHELTEDSRGLLGRGDVTVTAIDALLDERSEAASMATIDAPSQVRLPTVDRESLSYLEVRDRETLRVITVIELPSPSNKQTSPDREQYVAKRAQILNTAVHFIEIDLLRGGPRMPMDGLSECDYYVLVSRHQKRPHADVWPFQLHDPMPIVPVPLQPPDEDAKLDLRIALDRIYDAAGYEDYIYRGQPEPALSAEDTAWSEGLLA